MISVLFGIPWVCKGLPLSTSPGDSLVLYHSCVNFPFFPPGFTQVFDINLLHDLASVSDRLSLDLSLTPSVVLVVFGYYGLSGAVLPWTCCWIIPAPCYSGPVAGKSLFSLLCWDFVLSLLPAAYLFWRASSVWDLHWLTFCLGVWSLSAFGTLDSVLFPLWIESSLDPRFTLPFNVESFKICWLLIRFPLRVWVFHRYVDFNFLFSGL